MSGRHRLNHCLGFIPFSAMILLELWIQLLVNEVKGLENRSAVWKYSANNRLGEFDAIVG